VAVFVSVVADQVLRSHAGDPPCGVAHAQGPEHDQHERHQQLETHGEPGREHEVGHQQETAGQDQGRHVADAPEGAHQRPGGEAPLTAHDGGHRHQVVGIGRVLDAEDESQRDR